VKDSIFLKYRSNAVVRGGVVMFPVKIAVALVNDLRVAGVRVLGVDGFVLSEHRTEPHLEHSLDCSGDSDVAATVLDLLKNKSNSDLFFEVVCCDQ
jgi:hypothetical protein